MAGGFALINGALFISACDHHWNVNEHLGQPSPIQANMGGATVLIIFTLQYLRRSERARARARGRAEIDVASSLRARERVYVLIFCPKVPRER